MFTQLFRYHNTFQSNDDLNNMLSDPNNDDNGRTGDTSEHRVNNISDCAIAAFRNDSHIFSLSDFNNADSNGLARCQIAKNSNIEDIYRVITDLNECQPSDTCYTDFCGNNFGNGDNLSLYVSPTLFINILENNIQNINMNKFNAAINDINNNLTNYINSRRKYIEFTLDYIYVDNDTINFNSQSQDIDQLRSNMNNYWNKLDSSIKTLNKLFNELLKTTNDLNEHFIILNQLIELLNDNIFYAEQFFNILMNKNQGAIGELDITDYNRMLSIFENTVIITIIIIIIYLYLKNK